MRMWFVNLVCLSLLSSCASEPTAPGKLVMEEFVLSASFDGSSGPYVADLDTMVIRPDDNQAHPLAVINHGTIGHAEKRTFPKEMRGIAQEFARRGWIAVAFTRRGFGKSGGRFAEGLGKYPAAEYERSGRAAASDIREVIRLMAGKAYVNANRVISVGFSTGGFATVALTADPPPGLVAAINFAGGNGSLGPGSFVHNEAALIDAFGKFGKTSRIPMLWVYAVNDRSFGPALAKKLCDAFKDGGGKVDFIETAPLGNDGHQMFTRVYASVWTHYMDDFLAKQNLKLMEGLIAVDDETGVNFPSQLNPTLKKGFLDYLDAGDHKAFAVSSSQSWNWVNKQVSAEAAEKNVLRGCNDCNVVSIDGHAP